MGIKIIYKQGDFINGVKFISDEPNSFGVRYAIFECPYCKIHFKSRLEIIKRKIPRLRPPSCGCMRSVTHNLSKHKIHNIWVNMLSRTTCTKRKCYKNYGGRGIKMCDEWRRDFKSFYDWAVNNGYEEGLTIDRKDNDGNYSPENCRFVTMTVQNRNKRRSIKSKYPNGIIYSPKYDHYYCRITVDKKIIHLGTFNSVDEAVDFRMKYAKEHNLLGFYNDK